MAEKVAIITGASSGFGLLAALEACRRGHKVVVTARRAERLEELVGKAAGLPGEIVAVAGDINDDAHQQALIDTTIERFGRLDVLVNNAGLPLDKSFRESDVSELRRQWDTNTTSVITLTKRALPHLLRSRGTVITVSSSISRFSVPGWGLYSSSKVAASSVSDVLRRELSAYGVRVCTVEPGPYNTEFSHRAGDADNPMWSLDPQPVAKAMVDLFERPRRLVVMPLVVRPFLAIGGGAIRLLPDVADLIYWLMGRAQRRA